MADGGIACPNCGVVENYAGKTNVKQNDNSIYRTKECNNCGVRFATIEVPLGVVDVKRRNRTGSPADATGNPPPQQ